jgi:hypothetical protein
MYIHAVLFLLLSFASATIGCQDIHHAIKKIIAREVPSANEEFSLEDTVLVRYLIFYPIEETTDSVAVHIGMIDYDGYPQLTILNKSVVWFPKIILPERPLSDVVIPLIVLHNDVPFDVASPPTLREVWQNAPPPEAFGSVVYPVEYLTIQTGHHRSLSN